MKNKFLYLTTAILLTLSVSLEATHGYFRHGIGTKSSGMGGVATAYPQDSIIAAVNPAGMYWVGARVDAEIMFFSPIREYSYNADRVKSGRELFFVPSFGYNQRCNDCLTLGITAYGNGGMNTRYGRSNPAFGQGKMGIDYGQLIIAPTLSYRFAKCHTVGASILFGVQAIKLYGLENFSAFSSDPNHVSNHGYNFSEGIGARVGWMGMIYPKLWVGAAAATKVYMTKFRMYQGLLADKGKLHIPENLSLGIRYELTPCINVGFDWQHIFYSRVKPLANPIQNIGPGNLGTPGGAAFGWQDISVYKVGIDYKWNNCFTFRTGFSTGKVPYAEDQMDPNIIAPAVTKHHMTFGATYRLDNCRELDLAYAYVFENSQTGPSQGFGLGNITHKMRQHAIQINYGKAY